MLSTKLVLIALAVAAGLTAAIPTSADYLSVPDNEFIEASPADVTKPAELSQLLGAKPATDAATDGGQTVGHKTRSKVAAKLVGLLQPKGISEETIREASPEFIEALPTDEQQCQGVYVDGYSFYNCGDGNFADIPSICADIPSKPACDKQASNCPCTQSGDGSVECAARFKGNGVIVQFTNQGGHDMPVEVCCNSAFKPLDSDSASGGIRNLEITGRYEVSDHEAVLAWPGTAISFEFSSTHANLPLKVVLPKEVQVCEPSCPRFLVKIDDDEPRTQELTEGQTTLSLTATSDGEHRAVVTLTSEQVSMKGQFAISLASERGVDFIARQEEAGRKKRLLFLGDSDTVGFAIDGPTPGSKDFDAGCKSPAFLESLVSPYTNTSATYAARVADALNAEAHFIAVSGMGVHQNAMFTLMPETCRAPLLKVMDRTLPRDEYGSWDPNLFVPDAVVIMIGANDFVQKPNSEAPDAAQFQNHYSQLLAKIKSDWPTRERPPIFSLMAMSGSTGALPMDPIKKATEEYNSALSKAGIRTGHAHYLFDQKLWDTLHGGRWSGNPTEYKPTEHTTCMDHWTARGHELIAEFLLKEIGPHLSN